jgi:hypothetical protein
MVVGVMMFFCLNCSRLSGLSRYCSVSFFGVSPRLLIAQSRDWWRELSITFTARAGNGLLWVCPLLHAIRLNRLHHSTPFLRERVRNLDFGVFHRVSAVFAPPMGVALVHQELHLTVLMS